MSPRAKRETVLDDERHAAKVKPLLDQDEVWLTHDDERVFIDAMSPPHALSAYRKLIDYANASMLGLDVTRLHVVGCMLGHALKTQAFGIAASEAEIAYLKTHVIPGSPAPRPLRVSTVLAGVEAIDDEVKADQDTSMYVDPVDYAVRLTELINERLTK
jgi:hypothetical protein